MGQSLYRDHDIELTFDTLITQEDLDLVRNTVVLGECSLCIGAPLIRTLFGTWETLFTILSTRLYN